MNQIEVRIRHEDEPQAVPFCTWDVGRLDALIPLINKWGLSFDYGEPEADLSGQFVVADGAAFFEILIGATEPADS